MTERYPSLVFLDVELTGLDTLMSDILELAAFRVDAHTFEKVGEPFHMFVGLPASRDPHITPWARDVHEANGLLAACRALKTNKYDLDADLSAWLDRHFKGQPAPQLCGHSIHFDYTVIRHQLFNSFSRIHYRIRDYGQYARMMRELDCQIPEIPDMPHRAMDDCNIELQEAKNVNRLIKRLSHQPWAQ